MNNIVLAIIAVALVFISSQVQAGSNSSPETRGWVMEDGRYVDFWRSRQGIALKAKDAAEKAQKTADMYDRPVLMEAYIKHASWNGVTHDRARGIKAWNSMGAWKSTAELRKWVGVAGVAAVFTTAAGATEIEGAAVRLKNAEGAMIDEPQTEPGSTATSYKKYTSTSRKTDK